MKTMMRMPETIKRAIIRALPQAYVDPPHWRARSRDTMAGRKKKVPRRSNSASLAFHPTAVFLTIFGDLKKKKMKMAVIRPNGRLM